MQANMAVSGVDWNLRCFGLGCWLSWTGIGCYFDRGGVAMAHPHRCCHCFLTVSNNPMASGLMGRHRWREALTLLSTPESALLSAFPEFLHHHIARQFKCKVSIMANQFVDITECLCEAETLCLIERRNHCLRLKQITYQDHLVKGSMHA